MVNPHSSRAKDRTRIELLQALLRWKRAQLTRKDVGMHPRVGARHGLTQDDVAELTNYSLRLIGHLEQGKLRSPTPKLLDAVCSGLRFTPDERRILWLLAAGTAPPSDSYASGADTALTRLVDHLYPHPAYITDAAWNIEAFNKAVAEWFVDMSRFPRSERNIARWILCNPHAKHAFVNWDPDFAPTFLARMRAVIAKFPNDARLAAMVDELRQRSPYFAQQWPDGGDVYLDPLSTPRVLRRPGHTDPAQPDDEDHHVSVDVVILEARRTGDERRLVVCMLPEEETRRTVAPSTTACGACARLTAGG